MKKQISTCLLLLIITGTVLAQKTAEEAKTYFTDYKTTQTITDLIKKSFPTLEECKVVFKEQDAKAYFDYIQTMKEQMNNSPQKEGETFVDIGIETFTTQDIKDGKGNYAGGMTNVLPTLNDNITFYKVEQLRTIGATSGMAYNYWVFIKDKWVFIPKPWRLFK